MNQNRYLIIADDFTGANDTGVQLKRRGFSTDVIFDPALIGPEGSFVLDTESRGMSGREAFNAVSRLCEGIGWDSFYTVIKKIDSTLRGNVAEEIRAVDEWFGSELIVFVPALPDLGRTTVGGIHLLKGVPITETELSRDPKKPVTCDNLREILMGAFNERVEQVSLETIRAGRIDFGQARIYAFDSQTNADMQAVLSAAKATGKRILWVGTAAIADNLMELESRQKPSCGLVGSVSSVTRAQVAHAEAAGVSLIEVPVGRLLEGELTEESFIDAASARLAQGRDVLLLSAASRSPEGLAASDEAGRRLGKSGEEVSVYTQALLGRLAAGVLRRIPVSGVFLTGGDTAMGFFAEARSRGSSILTEVAVGIPMMKLRGGEFEGLRVITKAGAFGRDDTITYSLRKLKEAF